MSAVPGCSITTLGEACLDRSTDVTHPVSCGAPPKLPDNGQAGKRAPSSLVLLHGVPPRYRMAI